MAYTFLLFDLDHTLLDFESAEETALTQMLEDMNFPDVQAFKDYYKPMNQGLWKDLEQKKLTKQELVDSRFAIGFAHFGISVDGAEIALRYQDYISLQGQSFPGAEDLLARLEKGLPALWCNEWGDCDSRRSLGSLYNRFLFQRGLYL